MALCMLREKSLRIFHPHDHISGSLGFNHWKERRHEASGRHIINCAEAAPLVVVPALVVGMQ